MKTVQIDYNGQVIADCWLANNYFLRLRGLIGRKLVPDGGLLLSPCNQIHTFFMSYQIDAVYLDRQYQIVRIDHNIDRWKMLKRQKSSRFVLELPSGNAEKYMLKVNDILNICDTQEDEYVEDRKEKSH